METIRSRARRPVAILLALLLSSAVAAPPPARAADEVADAMRAVQKALGGKDPGPLADAVAALAPFDGVPAAKLLVSVAARPDAHPLVVETCLDSLRGFEDPEVLELLAREVEASRGPRRLLLLEAVGALPAVEAENTLLSALDSADPRVRTVATARLGRRKNPSPAARAALEHGLRDADPAVRSAAVAGLARGEVTGGLPLLHAMTRERGRLFGDAWFALRRLSGEKFPARPDSWADWWRTLPGEGKWRFDAPPPEPPEPSVVIAGLPTWSRRIVFVLDLSDGMGDEPGYNVEEMIPRRVREQGGDALEQWKAVKTRLDHAAALLRTTIDELPADVSFDVVFGGESVNALFRSLEPATAANRSRAASRLKGLNARGKQDFMGVLRQAMAEPVRDPAEEEAHSLGADTVVYLGTALPSHGAETDSRRILATVRRWNVTRQVSFLGVGVGTHNGDLLADLASLEPRGGSTAID